MAPSKTSAEHLESTTPAVHPEHEAALAGALALANLFSNCVEAFNLIHQAGKWEKGEQLLLVRLGIQQARLLIWGDIVGISSPPKSVTDRAVPKHPSAAYPDLNEPTFFSARDARLDQAEYRTKVEEALSAIVDRSAGHSREEMMEKYGLKPPKRFTIQSENVLDAQRLDSFREKYELLQEVGETYAQLSSKRNQSIVQTSWQIADQTKFANFISLTQEKIDFLIQLMGVKERVDRAMRMDIKALGWHLSADRTKVANDISKLRLMQENCQRDYPEYVEATKQALDNIGREAREKVVTVTPFPAEKQGVDTRPMTPPKSSHAHHHHANAGGNGEKRPSGIFGLFKRLKSSDRVPSSNGDARSKSAHAVPAASSTATAPLQPRTMSESGPSALPMGASSADDEDLETLYPLRSKSVGDILDSEGLTQDEEFIRNKLEQMRTHQSESGTGTEGGPVEGMVSRHDQYHGIARVATKDLNQGW